MHPILGSFGPWTFHTYTVLLAAGVTLTLAWLYFVSPDEQATRWLDAGLAGMVGGLVGARLGFVLANGAYFVDHPGEALAVWNGGLSWAGTAAGAALGLWSYCRRSRLSFPALLDALAFPIAGLSALSWGGCLAAGCAYGVEVVPGQFPVGLTAYAPDMYGLTLPRWPTQTVGVAASGLILVLLYALRKDAWPAGTFGLSALALVAAAAVALGFTRADPQPLIAGLRLEIWGSLLVLLACLTDLLAVYLRSPRQPPIPSNP